MYLILGAVANHMSVPGSNFTFTGFSQLFNDSDSSSFNNRCFVAEDSNLSKQTCQAVLAWGSQDATSQSQNRGFCCSQIGSINWCRIMVWMACVLTPSSTFAAFDQNDSSRLVVLLLEGYLSTTQIMLLNIQVSDQCPAFGQGFW